MDLRQRIIPIKLICKLSNQRKILTIRYIFHEKQIKRVKVEWPTIVLLAILPSSIW